MTVPAFRQLATLLTDVYQLIDRVQAGAESEEVELRVTSARAELDMLQATIGVGPTGSFDNLARHLAFVLHYHRKGQPQGYASDLADLRERDLPGVIHAVEEWATSALDPGLVQAIGPSWEAQHYGNAVRDAFIYLEALLRETGKVDPTQGMSSDRLVTTLLGPASGGRIKLSGDSFLGHLTGGETEGAYNFVKGAFLLFRNATAHRLISYTSAEAEDVIRVVNLCIRLLRPSGR